MAIQTKEYLYSRFETGDTPTQQDFRDIFDTLFNGGTAVRNWTQEVLGTGNGVTSAFPFTHIPANSATTFIFVNGIYQSITVDWNFVNNQAVFTVALPLGWVAASIYSY